MGVEKDERLEKGEVVEQQLHTAEEVEENPATNTPEVEKVDMDHTAQEIEESNAMGVEENPDVGVNPTEGFEIGPVEIADRNTTVPEREKVVVVSYDEEDAEKAPPCVEVVKRKSLPSALIKDDRPEKKPQGKVLKGNSCEKPQDKKLGEMRRVRPGAGLKLRGEGGDS